MFKDKLLDIVVLIFNFIVNFVKCDFEIKFYFSLLLYLCIGIKIFCECVLFFCKRLKVSLLVWLNFDGKKCY